MEHIGNQATLLQALLNKEVEAFRTFLTTEKQLQEKLYTHRWKEMNPILKSLRTLAKEIVWLEEQRDRVYKELRERLGLQKEETFYDVCLRLPLELREELTVRYRELKHLVIEIQNFSNGIDTYCTSSVSVLGRVLEELLPQGKHKVYSRRGTTVEAPKPLLVNQAL
ncbi:MAG: flagellar export chaperone FlgN [Spirochaetales bacterium]